MDYMERHLFFSIYTMIYYNTHAHIREARNIGFSRLFILMNLNGAREREKEGDGISDIYKWPYMRGFSTEHYLYERLFLWLQELVNFWMIIICGMRISCVWNREYENNENKWKKKKTIIVFAFS